MLSYRHAFHAGNHGDVLKHLCQLLLIEKLKEKDKPFVYIDTHSGAGLYDLESEEATKTGEYKQGIGFLKNYSGNNPLILEYKSFIEGYLAHNRYPGSPMFAKALCRTSDKIVLLELHNQEITNLKRNLRGANIKIHHRDGYEGVLALLPPKPNRGMVLIDPPYEVAGEYQQVSETIQKAIKKWPSGVFAVWYPILTKRAGEKRQLCEKMLHNFADTECKNLLQVELRVESPESDNGMIGSGLAIFNAPWMTKEKLQSVSPELVSMLGKDNTSQATVEWIIQES